MVITSSQEASKNHRGAKQRLKQQFSAQEAECTTLKSQLDCLQRANVSVVEAVRNKVQESFCKVSTMMAFNLHFQKHIETSQKYHDLISKIKDV